MKTLAVLVVTILLGYLWQFFPLDNWTPFPLSDYEISSHWYLNLLSYKIRFVLLVWLLYLNVKGNLRLVALVFLIFYGLNMLDYILFYDNPFPGYTFALKVIISAGLTYLMYHERSDNNNSGSKRFG